MIWSLIKQKIISPALKNLAKLGRIISLPRFNKQQKIILQTLEDLGGAASLKDIAQKTEIDEDKVLRALGLLSLRDYVEYVIYPAGLVLWKIIPRGIYIAKR